jgi:hypothetical protein
MSGLEKRTWVYLQSPKEYEIAFHGCGDTEPEWSEYKGHLWCPRCNIDFIPEFGGVFDGPIPINCAQALGLCFDRLNLVTWMVETLDSPHIKGLLVGAREEFGIASEGQ